MFGFRRVDLGLFVGQETEPSMDTWLWVPGKTEPSWNINS